MEKEATKIFTVNHQKITLDIDFSSRMIIASTELQLYFNSTEIPFIRLHSKRCDIHRVTINDQPTRFEVYDPCAQICSTVTATNTMDYDYILFHKVFDVARTTGDQGELAIEIPEDVTLSQHLSPSLEPKKEVETANTTEEQNHVASASAPTTPLLLKIDYSITEPDKGVLFSSNGRLDENNIASYLFTLNQLGPGDARYWVPSLDEAHEKCTWELDFIVTQIPDYKQSGPGYSVVASGVQILKEELSSVENRSIFRYFVPFPCPAYLLSFAIGRFDSILLTEIDNSKSDAQVQDGGEASSNKNVVAYSPVGWKDELRNSCQTVEKVMEYFINEFFSYPLDSVKLVFLQTSSSPLIVGAEVVILSLEFLYPEEVIDQTYETRRLIALALASQWIGVFVVPKQSQDIWLILGLCGYMTSLFLKDHFGHNEYRYRMKQDMLKIAHLDVNRPPIYNSQLTYAYDPEDINFIRLKSTFVLYMMDKQMIKGAAASGMKFFTSKILSSIFCGEMGSTNALGTHWFVKNCRKVSGVELKNFADQWIYSSGCPIFQFSYSFNRKKMVVEIDVKQTTTNADIINDQYASLDVIKPARIFTGHMTASIREPDGTPYEHVLDIQEDVTRFEVQFNTKYKRIRRNTKRFQKRKAETAAADAMLKDQLDAGNADNDDLFLTEEGKEKEKADWRIIEWGEADEESLESATFEWIRLDSDFEWICLIELDQPDYMWAGQLEKDRDVVSQFEAVVALRKFPSQATSTTLLRTVMNTQCFYRIRADAADALVYCSQKEFTFIGRHHLLRIFHKKYCIDELEDELQPDRFVPRPHDFSNLSEYFVQKAVVLAISNLNRTTTDPASQRLLLNLLTNNDNSNNTFSDCYYISSLIIALGNALRWERNPSASSTAGRLLEELKRYSTMDYLIPSYHNVITVSCLQTYTKLYLQGVIPPDLLLLMKHSRYGNFLHVRLAAYDGLLVLGGLLIPTLRNYLFQTMEDDPDYSVRYYIACNVARLAAIYQGKSVESGDMLGEEYSESDYAFSNQKYAQFRASADCKQIIRRMLLNSHLDYRVRTALNILCSIMYDNHAKDNLDFSGFLVRVVHDTGSNGSVPAATNGEAPKLIPASEPILEAPLASPGQAHTATPTQSTKGPVSKPEPPAAPLIPEKQKLIESPPKEKSSYYQEGDTMPESDVNLAKRLLRRLIGHACAVHVLNKPPQTVDPITGDPEVHPGSLKKIKSRLYQLKYNSLSGFKQNLEDLFAFSFQHPTNNQMVVDCETLHAFYLEQWDKVVGGVAKVATKEPPAPVYSNAEPENLVPLPQANTTIPPRHPVSHRSPWSKQESPFSQTRGTHNNRRRSPSPDLHLLHWDNNDNEIYTPVIQTPPPQEEEEFFSEPRSLTPESLPPTTIRLIAKPPRSPKDRNHKSRIDQPKKHHHSRVPVSPSPKRSQSYNLSPRQGNLRSSSKSNRKENRRFRSRSPSPLLSPPRKINFKSKVPLPYSDDHHRGSQAGKKRAPVEQPLPPVKLSIKLKPPPPPIVEPPPPKSPTDGSFYHSEDYNLAKSVLKTLSDSKEAPLFLVPPEEGKGSLSLKSIRIRLKKGQYFDKEEMYNDLYLMFSDYLRNYRHDSENYTMGKKLKKKFVLLWQETFPEPVRVEKRAPPPSVTIKSSVTPLNLDKDVERSPKRRPTHKSASNLAQTAIVASASRAGKSDSKKERKASPSPSPEVHRERLKVTLSKPQRRPRSPELLTVEKRRPTSLKVKEPSLPRQKSFSPRPPRRVPEVAAPTPPRGGDSDLLYKFCKRLLDRLDNHPSSSSFRIPVDPVLLGIPTYFEVIKHPMDLRTIRTRLEARKYLSFTEFDHHVKLIVDNACLFNQPESWVYKEAETLREFYTELTSNFNGKFLTRRDERNLQELISKIRDKPYSEHFLPPTKFAKYMKEPKDLDIIHDLVESKHFVHIDEVEEGFRDMVITAFALYAKGSDEFSDVLRFEKCYTRTFEGLFGHPSRALGQLSQSTLPHLMTQSMRQKCTQLLKKLRSLRAAQDFLNPVDHVALKIPAYPMIIKQPMDFGTIKRKLESGKYHNSGEFEFDVMLVFRNCYNFNGTDSLLSENALKVERIFKKERAMIKSPTSDAPGAESTSVAIASPPPPAPLSPQTLRLMQAALVAMKQQPDYLVFGSPVDPVMLEIPTYFDIIRHPMDFGTIQANLKAGKYTNLESFLNDAKLVFDNCYLFNRPGEPVYQMGKELEIIWDRICSDKGLK